MCVAEAVQAEWKVLSYEMCRMQLFQRQEEPTIHFLEELALRTPLE